MTDDQNQANDGEDFEALAQWEKRREKLARMTEEAEG